MIERFVANRRARWERLSTLLNRSRSTRSHLSVDELDEMARLYRQTTSDLAVARRDFPSDGTTRYINELVARAYGQIYREPPAPRDALVRFFRQELPQEFRSAWPYLVAAAVLFFGPLIASLIAILVHPDSAELMVPARTLNLIKSGRHWFDIPEEQRSVMATFIMTNNIQVSFLALAGGMTAGLLTCWVLVSNGISIGAISGALTAYGLGESLVWWIAGHGFLELSVIVIAGACGLMLGKAILWPGLQTRKDALSIVGARSMRLLLGTIPFMAVAGVIEGFFSPLLLHWSWKLALGIFTGVVMYAYLLLVGRESAATGAHNPSARHFIRDHSSQSS
ncbi:MAG: stage II sporulation protein M [Chloroflexota bacterium]